jgi:hypothetical protein
LIVFDVWQLPYVTMAARTTAAKTVATAFILLYFDNYEQAMRIAVISYVSVIAS